MSRKYVIDTNALDASVFSFRGDGAENMTVPSVLKEARRLFFASVRLENPPEIEVKEPKPKYVDRVRQKVKEVGESLSSTDKELLALALEVNGEVVTDDYGMQHLAELMDIRYSPLEYPSFRGREGVSTLG